VGNRPLVDTRTPGKPQGLTIAVAAFLPIMAIVSLAPAVPRILEHFRAVPHADILVPLMVTAPGAMVALFSPLAGWATDLFGRRRLLLISTFLYGLLGITPLFLNELHAIFATRLGEGVAEAFILTITNTLIVDYFAVDPRRKWLMVQGIIGPVFGTSVIALSGFFTERVWNGAFWIYFVAFIVFAAMVTWIYEPAVVPEARTAPVSNSTNSIPRSFRRTVLIYSSVTLLSAVLYYIFIVQGGLAFDAIGVKSASGLGVLISIASIGVPIGAVLFGLMAKRCNAGALIAVFLALFGIGMLGIGWSKDPREMTVFALIQQMGAGMSVSSLIFWVAKLLPAEHRGRGMGIWVCAFFLGQFLSPVAVGALRGITGGIQGTFMFMGALSLVSAIVALILSRRQSSPTES
jgi:MFS family permease